MIESVEACIARKCMQIYLDVNTIPGQHEDNASTRPCSIHDLPKSLRAV